ncbi:MAG: hypothetical protein AABZ63_04600 [Actinomycetota bacterium]
MKDEMLFNAKRLVVVDESSGPVPDLEPVPAIERWPYDENPAQVVCNCGSPDWRVHMIYHRVDDLYHLVLVCGGCQKTWFKADRTDLMPEEAADAVEEARR